MDPIEEHEKRLNKLEAKVAEQAKKIEDLEARLGTPRPVHEQLDGKGLDGKGSARPLDDFMKTVGKSNL